MTLTITKTGGTPYSVRLDGAYIGCVWKEQVWTIRGDRVQWAASNNGTIVGLFESRKEAAAALVKLTSKENWK